MLISQVRAVKENAMLYGSRVEFASYQPTTTVRVFCWTFAVLFLIGCMVESFIPPNGMSRIFFHLFTSWVALLGAYGVTKTRGTPWKDVLERHESHNIYPGYDVVWMVSDGKLEWRTEKRNERNALKNKGKFCLYSRLGGWSLKPRLRLGYSDTDSPNAQWRTDIKIKVWPGNPEEEIVVTDRHGEYRIPLLAYLEIANISGCAELVSAVLDLLRRFKAERINLEDSERRLKATEAVLQQKVSENAELPRLFTMAMDALFRAHKTLAYSTRFTSRYSKEADALMTFLRDRYLSCKGDAPRVIGDRLPDLEPEPQLRRKR